MATKKKAAPTGAKALSLHLGLNSVSPAHYGGWSGDLAACEFDANDMAAIAKAQGMKPTVLLTKKATRDATLAALRSAAATLKAGDLFFLTFSGHGGQVDDVSGEEEDRQDETWCLYDCQLIDDELFLELGRFAKGVRVLVLSDSCHSGTVVRAAPPAMLPVAATPAAAVTWRSKAMPTPVAMRTYREHKAFYDNLQLAVTAAAGGKAVADPDAALAQVQVSGRLTSLAAQIDPSVILISGCQDNQTSLDGMHNGAFTEQVLSVWNNGGYKGNYAQFHASIKARMPATQTPNLFTLGPVGDFAGQQPFALQ